MSNSKTITVSPDILGPSKSGYRKRQLVPSKVHDNLNTLKKNLLMKLQNNIQKERDIPLAHNRDIKDVVTTNEDNNNKEVESLENNDIYEKNLGEIQEIQQNYEKKQEQRFLRGNLNSDSDFSKPVLNPIHIRNKKEPEWGCLKTGKKPTFSKYKTLKKNKKKFKRKTKQLVGKHKKTRKVSICIKSKKMKSKIAQDIKTLDKKPLKEIIQYMKNRNLIRGYTDAPEHMLRDMYKQCVLSGDVKNNNRKKLVQHYLYHE